jgi:hypothetical protein
MQPRKILLFCTVALSILSCRKHMQNPCEGLTPPTANFGFKETLSDTAFFTDTAYWDNAVNFVALDKYASVNWKIGTDPRNFANADFSLPFYMFTGTVDVNFTGRNMPNTQCFPADSGVYRGSKKLTLVEQFNRATLTLSPLIGRYRGAFTNTPADTFTVRIEYFDSAKYDVSMLGVRNFYWVSNFPKNYIDSTSNIAAAYPELRRGQRTEMGYKCAQFGDGGSEGRNFLELRGDTIKIFSSFNGLRKAFMGKRL